MALCQLVKSVTSHFYSCFWPEVNLTFLGSISHLFFLPLHQQYFAHWLLYVKRCACVLKQSLNTPCQVPVLFLWVLTHPSAWNRCVSRRYVSLESCLQRNELQTISLLFVTPHACILHLMRPLPFCALCSLPLLSSPILNLNHLPSPANNPIHWFLGLLDTHL